MSKISYSRYSMYAKCPSQYEWHYILKKPRKKSPALDRGLEIHSKAEKFVQGELRKLPAELHHFSQEFAVLRKMYKEGIGHTEPDVSINAKWTASTKAKTDFIIAFADFLKIIETSPVSVIVDYKTGKKYSEHKDQGHMYATCIMTRHPWIDHTKVKFWYVDYDDAANFEWRRKDLAQMQRTWQARHDKMYGDKKFRATPNKFCNWCARNIKNGGDCKKAG